jgi:hypothetical protein
MFWNPLEEKNASGAAIDRSTSDHQSFDGCCEHRLIGKQILSIDREMESIPLIRLTNMRGKIIVQVNQ